MKSKEIENKLNYIKELFETNFVGCTLNYEDINKDTKFENYLVVDEVLNESTKKDLISFIKILSKLDVISKQCIYLLYIKGYYISDIKIGTNYDIPSLTNIYKYKKKLIKLLSLVMEE